MNQPVWTNEHIKMRWRELFDGLIGKIENPSHERVMQHVYETVAYEMRDDYEARLAAISKGESPI